MSSTAGTPTATTVNSDTRLGRGETLTGGSPEPVGGAVAPRDSSDWQAHRTGIRIYPGVRFPAASRAAMRRAGVRIVAALAGLGALLVPGSARHTSGQATPPASDWQAFQKTVQPFFAKHCFDCRSEERRVGKELRSGR